MRARWEQAKKYYRDLSLRERVLVASSMLVAVTVAWFLLVASPLLGDSQQVHRQQQTLQASMQKLVQQEAALRLKLQQDPLHDLKQRVAQLDRQLAQSNNVLKQQLQGLIPPKQMASMLESVLQQHHDLTLLRVKSLPAQPLVPPSKANESSRQSTARHQTQVYRHGLELQLEGSYLATLEYLKALQALPWKFYWDAVRLQVEKYPKAKITIRVHTLSLTEGWIGV